MLGGVLLVVAAGAAAAVVLTSQPGDVSNPDVEFTQEQQPPTVAADRPDRRRAHPFDDGFAWPIYGYTKARTRCLPLDVALRPPFVQEWALTGRVLIEFPPVLCGRSLYLLKNNGALYAISRVSGRVRWKRKLGEPRRRVARVRERDRLRGAARARQGDQGAGASWRSTRRTGARAGRARSRSRVESSPLLDSGRLYFGSEDGTVYALRASDGAVRWRYKASGAVKGGLALKDGKLFFGDYGGKVHGDPPGRRAAAVAGRRAPAARFGLRAGRFYSTPAVAYGRVYIGSLDGFVYSFAARNGKLAWRHKTGGFVYSSPAVASVGATGRRSTSAPTTASSTR